LAFALVAVAFFALAAAGRVDFAIVSESRWTGVDKRVLLKKGRRRGSGGK